MYVRAILEVHPVEAGLHGEIPGAPELGRVEIRIKSAARARSALEPCSPCPSQASVTQMYVAPLGIDESSQARQALRQAASHHAIRAGFLLVA